MDSKVVLIISNGLLFNRKYYLFRYPFSSNNEINVNNVLQIRLWVTSFDVRPRSGKIKLG